MKTTLKSWLNTTARLALLAGMLCLPMALAQQRQAPGDIVEPVMLVATDRLADPIYAHSVLLVRPVGDRMHVGIILNKQTGSSLAALFPDHEASKLVDENVFFGGPMSRNTLAALTRASLSNGSDALDFGSGLRFVVQVDEIDSIIEKTPNDARYYVGNVVWRSGELAREIERGLWQVIPVSSDLAFRKDTSHLWDELHDDGRLVRAGWSADTRMRRRPLSFTP